MVELTPEQARQQLLQEGMKLSEAEKEIGSQRELLQNPNLLRKRGYAYLLSPAFKKQRLELLSRLGESLGQVFSQRGELNKYGEQITKAEQQLQKVKQYNKDIVLARKVARGEAPIFAIQSDQQRELYRKITQGQKVYAKSGEFLGEVDYKGRVFNLPAGVTVQKNAQGQNEFYKQPVRGQEYQYQNLLPAFEKSFPQKIEGQKVVLPELKQSPFIFTKSTIGNQPPQFYQSYQPLNKPTFNLPQYIQEQKGKLLDIEEKGYTELARRIGVPTINRVQKDFIPPTPERRYYPSGTSPFGETGYNLPIAISAPGQEGTTRTTPLSVISPEIIGKGFRYGIGGGLYAVSRPLTTALLATDFLSSGEQFQQTKIPTQKELLVQVNDHKPEGYSQQEWSDYLSTAEGAKFISDIKEYNKQVPEYISKLKLQKTLLGLSAVGAAAGLAAPPVIKGYRYLTKPSLRFIEDPLLGELPTATQLLGTEPLFVRNNLAEFPTTGVGFDYQRGFSVGVSTKIRDLLFRKPLTGSKAFEYLTKREYTPESVSEALKRVQSTLEVKGLTGKIFVDIDKDTAILVGKQITKTVKPSELGLDPSLDFYFKSGGKVKTAKVYSEISEQLVKDFASQDRLVRESRLIRGTPKEITFGAGTKTVGKKVSSTTFATTVTEPQKLTRDVYDIGIKNGRLAIVKIQKELSDDLTLGTRVVKRAQASTQRFAPEAPVSSGETNVILIPTETKLSVSGIEPSVRIRKIGITRTPFVRKGTRVNVYGKGQATVTTQRASTKTIQSAVNKAVNINAIDNAVVRQSEYAGTGLYEKTTETAGLVPRVGQATRTASSFINPVRQTFALSSVQREDLGLKLGTPQKLGIATKLDTPQKVDQALKLAQAQIHVPGLKVTSPQINPITPHFGGGIRTSPPVQPVPTPRLKHKKKEGRGRGRRLLPAYSVLIKKGKRFVPVRTGLPRGRALQYGSNVVGNELSRQFKIVKSGSTEGQDINFKPSSRIYRGYAVKRGRPRELVDQYIQRLSATLQTPREKSLIRRAKLSRRVAKYI